MTTMAMRAQNKMPKHHVNGRKNGYDYGNDQRSGHGFNLATVAQMLLIPALTGGVYFLIQWGTQGDTLKRHEIAINETIPREIRSEQEAREKARNEFLDKLTKLNDGISTLNTTIAVMAEQNKQIVTTLSKLDGGRR